MRPTYKIAAFCSFLTLAAALVATIAPPHFTNASKPVRGMKTPVLSIEFAQSVQDVDWVLSDKPSLDREVMLTKLTQDYFFIAAYSALFVCMGLLLMRRGGRGKWFGLLGIHLALAAAILDLVEDFAITSVCNTPLAQTTQAMVDAIRRPSIAKWILAFLAIGLLSQLFFGVNRRFWMIMGFFWMAVAFVGLTGAIVDPRFIETAMAPLPLLLFGQMILFWFWTDRPRVVGKKT
jgi:hypothetical protein